MKRYLYIMSFLFTFTGITTTNKAKANNLPFVSWRNGVPQRITQGQLINSLQQAAQGQEITALSGAVQNASADDYIAVWGKSLYNEIVSADLSQFSFGLSSGGERNNGIYNGHVVPSPALSAGVRIIFFTASDGQKIPIAKWGDDGCLNPLGEIHREQRPVIRQNQPETQTVFLQPSQPAYNNQQVTVVNPSISWEQGKNIYDQGRNDRELDMYRDADLYTHIQQSGGGSNNCGGCGTTTTTIGQPTYVVSVPQQGGGNYNQNEPVRTKPNWAQVVNMGANTISAVFNGMEVLGGRRQRYYQTGYYYHGGGGYGGRVYNNDPLNPYVAPVVTPTGGTRRYNNSQLNGQIANNPYVGGSYGGGYNNQPLGGY